MLKNKLINIKVKIKVTFNKDSNEDLNLILHDRAMEVTALWSAIGNGENSNTVGKLANGNRIKVVCL